MKHTIVIRFTSVALFLILLSTFCNAKPILLRYKYRPNEVLNYKEVNRIVQRSELFNVDHIDVLNEHTASFQCLAVNPDSSVDLILKFVKAEMKVNDEKTHSELVELLDVPISVRQLATGKFVEVKPQGDVNSTQKKLIERLGKDMSVDFGFPDRAVDVGDKWNDQTAISEDLGQMRVEEVLSMKSIFEGYETVQGVRCAVINLSVTVKGTLTSGSTESPVEGKGRGLTFFDYTNGKLVQEWFEFETTTTLDTPKGPVEIQSAVHMEKQLQP